MISMDVRPTPPPQPSSGSLHAGLTLNCTCSLLLTFPSYTSLPLQVSGLHYPAPSLAAGSPAPEWQFPGSSLSPVKIIIKICSSFVVEAIGLDIFKVLIAITELQDSIKWQCKVTP